MDRGAWRATVQGVRELDVTEHAHTGSCCTAHEAQPSICEGPEGWDEGGVGGGSRGKGYVCVYG